MLLACGPGSGELGEGGHEGTRSDRYSIPHANAVRMEDLEYNFEVFGSIRFLKLPTFKPRIEVTYSGSKDQSNSKSMKLPSCDTSPACAHRLLSKEDALWAPLSVVCGIPGPWTAASEWRLTDAETDRLRHFCWTSKRALVSCVALFHDTASSPSALKHVLRQARMPSPFHWGREHISANRSRYAAEEVMWTALWWMWRRSCWLS